MRNKTIGEIVAENYLMSEVFQKHGIDFCCHGDLTLAEVCEQNALKWRDLTTELAAIAQQGNRTHHFDSWQLDYLMDHIIHTHHYYVWVNLPVIKEYALKVSRRLGDRYPQTNKMYRLVVELTDELEKHQREEEDLYFPYIRNMVQAQKMGQKRAEEHLLQDALEELHADHIYLGAILKMIRALAEDFVPPENSGVTMGVYYQKLRDFQDDFYQHIHLENNILYPKALALESSSWQEQVSGNN